MSPVNSGSAPLTCGAVTAKAASPLAAGLSVPGFPMEVGMSAVDSREINDDFDDSIVNAIGRSWWILLVGGIISVAIGIAAIVWPGRTIIVVAVLFAIWLIVSGIVSLVRGFGHGLTGGTRALYLITGIISILLGIFALRSAFQAAEILAIFIGIAFLFRGFAALFTGFESTSSRGWNIFFGIVILIGGIVILVWPGLSLLTLALVAGIWLIILGIYEIVAAFRVRSLMKV